MTIKFRSIRATAWAAAFGLALVLFAGQALALGLGRIEVKSRAGQPLLAEIQVISSDAAELDALRARLASPETFRRIGLQPPEGIVSDLQFAVALDARGNPVIRVTTVEPVTQPALTFLVEVDWGQGRLVREYSALVDAPQTVSAPAQPSITAPVAAPSDRIVRAPLAAATEGGADTAAADASSASNEDAGADADGATREDTIAESAAEPAAPPVQRSAPTPTPAPAAAAAPAPAPPVATAASTEDGEYGPVQAGETIGAIAARMAGEGVTREQAIVALFRANPGAFIANNLNLVREGAVLRVPAREEMAGVELRESRALLREQIAAWREMTQPAPQPEAGLAAGPGSASGTATDDAGTPNAAAAGESVAAAPATTPAAAAAPAADARLEIVPPSASDGRQAGTRSGIQAGGEGEMLRQELQQNQETIAAREAEVAELKARVADLERLQAKQAQLISMKDSELAAVQERLASTSDTAAETPQAATAAESGSLPWVWIGLGLLLVAAVAWLLLRRALKASPRPRFDTAVPVVPPAQGRDAGEPADAVAHSAVLPEAPPAGGTLPATPPWHAGEGSDSSAAGTSAAPLGDPAAPVGTSTAPAGGPDARVQHPSDAPLAADPAATREASDDAAIASLNPAPAGAERIELARAYLDLGDVDTARDLLHEVAAGGEPEARAEASRLLEGIA